MKGRCLCNAVRYETTGPLISADHFHCSMCQRQRGAAFSTYAEFHAGNFKWLSGARHLTTYELPTGGGWTFCNQCGSTIAGTDTGKITSITLGTIDGNPSVKPNSHIYVGSKANWHDIQGDLPQFEQRKLG